MDFKRDKSVAAKYGKDGEPIRPVLVEQFPKGDSEVREDIKDILTRWHQGEFMQDDAVDKINALSQQEIQAESNAIIRCVIDAKRVHPDWVIDDVIDLLKFREETRQVLKGQSLKDKGEVS